MKVVHLTTVPNSLRFLSGQVRFLKGHGYQFHVISSPGTELGEFSRTYDVVADAVPMPRRISPIADLMALARIVRILRSVRPEIVHAHTPKAGLLGMLAAWMARVPVRIYHVHGLRMDTASGWRRWVLWGAERTSCGLAQQIYCVSSSLREHVLQQNLAEENRVKVPANGTIDGIDAQQAFSPESVTSEERAAVRAECGIPPERQVLGFVGRIVRDKGVEVLVGAWQVLRDRFPELHLLLVGYVEDQNSLSEGTRRIIESDPRVHCTGFVKRPARYYAIMDVLALPSHREGFGLAAAEASAMSVPVVASRIPGCMDAVADGSTGTLIPVGNVDELTAAIERYLRDPFLRRTHGQAGRERVLREFRPEVIWEAMLNEYRSLLQGRGLPVLPDGESDDATVRHAA